MMRIHVVYHNDDQLKYFGHFLNFHIQRFITSIIPLENIQGGRKKSVRKLEKL